MNKEEKYIIKEYLYSNDLSDYEKKVIIHSLRKLKDEELINVTKENVRNRLKKVLEELQKSDATPLTEDRIRKELNILDKLLNPNTSRKDIIEASFQVECLYYDSDLEPEKTNTIYELLKKRNDNKGRTL